MTSLLLLTVLQRPHLYSFSLEIGPAIHILCFDLRLVASGDRLLAMTLTFLSPACQPLFRRHSPPYFLTPFSRLNVRNSRLTPLFPFSNHSPSSLDVETSVVYDHNSVGSLLILGHIPTASYQASQRGRSPFVTDHETSSLHYWQYTLIIAQDVGHLCEPP
jgi:hypothetical protein